MTLVNDSRTRIKPLALASGRVLDPFGPAARSDPPVFFYLRSSWCLLRPPRALRSFWCLSLDPPVCPPVPLVSLGSYSGVVVAQL
jgi:hypothetical protein